MARFCILSPSLVLSLISWSLIRAADQPTKGRLEHELQFSCHWLHTSYWNIWRQPLHQAITAIENISLSSEATAHSFWRKGMQQQQQHSYWNISKSAVPFNSGLDQSGNVLSHGLGTVFPERKFLVSYAQRHTSIPPFPYLPQQTSANRCTS